LCNKKILKCIFILKDEEILQKCSGMYKVIHALGGAFCCDDAAQDTHRIFVSNRVAQRLL